MLEKIMILFASAMAIVYTVIGIIIIMSEEIFGIVGWQKQAIGIIILSYGVYRIIKTIYNYKNASGE